MQQSRKRSVSPTSVPARTSRLKRFFHYLTSENSVENTAEVNEGTKSNYKIGTLDGNEIKASNIVGFDDVVSDKRRRISIQQTKENKGYIPRSSVDYSDSRGSKYNSYLQRLKEEDEEETTNLEQRATAATFEDGGEDGEYDSPIPDIQDVRRKSVQLIDRLTNGAPGSQLAVQRTKDIDEDHIEHNDDDYSINSDEVYNEDGYPIVIEHEFAPLYRDEGGNLVRPPFINLAPRERYQLLQLKRSIETSQALQSQLKYMVNPRETQSIQDQNSSKVETSTQTYDINYLRKKLHFNDYIQRKSGPKTKPESGAMFSGEFFYDVEEEKPTQENKLNGYLGSVSKPQFKKSTSKHFDNHFTDNSDIRLDSDYLSKKDKISDIIKLKDSKPTSKSTVEPSSGFQFSINKEDINDLMNKRKEDDDLVKKARINQTESSEKPAPSFSLQPKTKDDKSNEKPSISFNLGSEKPKTAESSKKLPAFNFGPPKPSDSNKENKDSGKPQFSFGSKDGLKLESSTGSENKKSTFSFGASTAPSESNSKPQFSFGASKKTEEDDKPKLNFGAAASSQGKPTFSFGKSDDKPAFNLGKKDVPEKSEEDEEEHARKRKIRRSSSEKPAVSFGDKKDEAPNFSFGATEKKDEAPKFSFGAEKKQETPKFSFGAEKKEETPKFSFGAEKKQETPKFSFGAEKKQETSKFSFGASEKKEDTPKFSFGATSGTKEGTPFSIGASSVGSSTTEKKEETPKFTFGASNNKDAKTGFSFGNTQKPALNEPKSGSLGPEERKSPFNFGSTEKPSFNFGATTQPTLNFTPNNVNTGNNPSASVPPPSKSPFQFGAVEKPKLQADSPFGSQATPQAMNNINTIGSAPAPGTNSGFQFANGVTPIKPAMPNQSFGFNKEGTPSSFNFSRSNTPDFGQANGQAIPGMNPSMTGSNPSMPAMNPGMNPGMFSMNQGMASMSPAPGMNMANPNVNRPNRKIAQIRRRRGG